MDEIISIDEFNINLDETNNLISLNSVINIINNKKTINPVLINTSLFNPALLTTENNVILGKKINRKKDKPLYDRTTRYCAFEYINSADSICKIHPTYINYDDNPRNCKKYCNFHRDPNMVNIVHRMCSINKRCTNIADYYYYYENSTYIRACAAHKKGPLFKRGKTCIVENCCLKPTYYSANKMKPIICPKHVKNMSDEIRLLLISRYKTDEVLPFDKINVKNYRTKYLC